MAVKSQSLFFDMLEKGARQGMIPSLERKSKIWFRKEAESVGNVDEKLMMKVEPVVKRSQITIGKMYMYLYDAKHKDKLPYWDRFPLIFPIESYNDGFLGLNMHYLARPLRARLMDALYTFASSPTMTDKQKLRISYDTLKGSAKHKAFEPTIHRYLASHVRTPLYEVPGQYWQMALFLPTERFQKASNSKVWRESANKIRANWGSTR